MYIYSNITYCFHVKDQGNIVVNGATTYDILGLRNAMVQLTAPGGTTIIIEADPGPSYRERRWCRFNACAQAHLTKVAHHSGQTGLGPMTPSSHAWCLGPVGNPTCSDMPDHGKRPHQPESATAKAYQDAKARARQRQGRRSAGGVASVRRPVPVQAPGSPAGDLS